MVSLLTTFRGYKLILSAHWLKINASRGNVQAYYGVYQIVCTAGNCLGVMRSFLRWLGDSEQKKRPHDPPIRFSTKLNANNIMPPAVKIQKQGILAKIRITRSRFVFSTVHKSPLSPRHRVWPWKTPKRSVLPVPGSTRLADVPLAPECDCQSLGLFHVPQVHISIQDDGFE